MTVTARKLGGSLAVLIPRAVARETGLTEGAALDVAVADDAIILRRSGRRPRRSLKAIVAQLRPAAYRRRTKEFAADVPVGKEVW